uniref:Mitochondrial sodium/hydrogen exchanger 9B2-like n=1 Tax=Hippocampus comes TaxID=109280 RepID=A0A3Q2Y7Z5_HIPCM
MCSCCASSFSRLRSRCPRPRGLISLIVTKACMLALLFGAAWSVTGNECLPGGRVFGVVIIFISAVLGGRLLGMVQFPGLPPIPPLLGMLLAGLVLRNVPYVTDAVHVDAAWSAALRSVALSIILARAGLGLDPSVPHVHEHTQARTPGDRGVLAGAAPPEGGVPARGGRAVCGGGLRGCRGFSLPVGSAVGVGLPTGVCPGSGVTSCGGSIHVTAAEGRLRNREGNLQLSLDWPAIRLKLCQATPEVPLGFDRRCLGLPQGIPTLLMAAGSFDDILAITGFSTCLGVTFSTGSTWMSVLKGLLEVAGGVLGGILVGVFLCFFPSADQEDVVATRSFLLLAFSIFAVFFTQVVGASGAGGLCTLVLAFLAALGWRADKIGVAAILGRCWDVFQPLLFGLIGAEIVITTLSLNTVGLGVAVIAIGLVVRLATTFAVVHGAGFMLKEKFFIAIAWLPKATVQAAIGSTALDTARDVGDETLVKFGLDVLTLAVLAILITAPIGALGIGLAGPRLLSRQVKVPEPVDGFPAGQTEDPAIFESRL